MRTLQDIDIANKKVLLRVDFNAPVKDGQVSDDTRLRAALPTINYLRERGATLVLMSHLGRPKGKAEDRYRLAPVAKRLQELLDEDVRYIATDSCVSEASQSFIATAPAGTVSLLENTRFDAREKSNDPDFAAILASYGDVFINDAFGAAHRAHASTEAVAHLLPSGAGLLLEKEVNTLTTLISAPQKPFKVILGGAKVSDKIGVIENLLTRVDEIFIGGAMAYTFIKAQGGQVGQSLVEDDKLELAKALLAKADATGVRFHLPQDSVCAREVSSETEITVHASNAIPEGWLGLDIGPQAVQHYQQALQGAKTILWNGPMGVFEVPPFHQGTEAIAITLSKMDVYSVVGGGDSVAAINALGVAEHIDHISTGGGASLELLEGKDLPGVKALS